MAPPALSRPPPIQPRRRQPWRQEMCDGRSGGRFLSSSRIQGVGRNFRSRVEDKGRRDFYHAGSQEHRMIASIAIAASLTLLQGEVPRDPQTVAYRIEARLDESTDVLTARARISYTNNAREALDTLWFHQHLNAFRPKSAWAERELELGNRRFSDLGPDDHAFERLTRASVAGESVLPVYPGAPDSTVVAIPLREPLRTGQTVVLDLDWDARLSTLPRRQGRRGRHFDFAQWYPRIAAYTDEGWQVQPLLPQGEFFGEFAEYDITLDVATDQVIGATGVPVEGDPGWANSALSDPVEIRYQRDFYPQKAELRLGLLSTSPSPDRKRVRWRAADVHHFAWSMDPTFVYQGSTLERSSGGQIAVHVLMFPGDADWEDVALERTISSLGWLQDVFGGYPWPQLTNLHRLESGGTEFPMLQMNGSPSAGLIQHETAHQFVHGLLANNEFREGWLDEGFAEYLTRWYAVEQGQPAGWAQDLDLVRQYEGRGRSEPIGLPGAEFSEPQTYSVMTYAKAELVLRMLEYLIGQDGMRNVFRTYFDRYAPGHVDEEAFVSVVEDVSGKDLDWFFDQWIRTTDQLDYSVARATTARQAEGSWETTVVVRRQGDAWMPVTLQVGSVERRLESMEREQTVTVVTPERPREAVLDPEGFLLDVAPGNNRARVD